MPDTFLPYTQSAEKQGNQLHMNVYKMKSQACGGGALKTEVKELKGDMRPAPPYPSRVKTVDKGTQVTPEREPVRNWETAARVVMTTTITTTMMMHKSVLFRGQLMTVFRHGDSEVLCANHPLVCFVVCLFVCLLFLSTHR